MAIHHYLPRCFPSFLLLILLQSIIVNSHSIHSADGQYVLAFKNLVGHRKGDNATNIHLVKKYLKTFGYLPSDGHNNVRWSSLGEDDYFDDRLESAIKTYQLNYNLNATGILNAQTIQQILTPRCGVPDIVNGQTSMNSGKNQSHLGSSGLHEASNFSFFPNAPRWPSYKYRLTYAFHTSVPFLFRPSIARAFSRWATISPFTFQQSLFYVLADLKVGFYSRSHGDGLPFDGPGPVLAHAFAPTDGRFHYDNDEPWDIYLRIGTFDVETVAVHEIGHLLGLGHSSVPAAIMYPSISSATRKTTFNNDDIIGISVLYNL